jgi:hypothetical protein
MLSAILRSLTGESGVGGAEVALSIGEAAAWLIWADKLASEPARLADHSMTAVALGARRKERDACDRLPKTVTVGPYNNPTSRHHVTSTSTITASTTSVSGRP